MAAISGASVARQSSRTRGAPSKVVTTIAERDALDDDDDDDDDDEDEDADDDEEDDDGNDEEDDDDDDRKTDETAAATAAAAAVDVDEDEDEDDDDKETVGGGDDEPAGCARGSERGGNASHVKWHGCTPSERIGFLLHSPCASSANTKALHESLLPIANAKSARSSSITSAWRALRCA